MALVQGHGDLAVYSIGGTSYLGLIKGVSYEFSPTNADSSPITIMGTRRQTVKKSVKISSSHMSTSSGDSGLVVGNLHVSGLSIGGVSFISYLRGGSFSGSFTHREVSSVGDVWSETQIFGKDYRTEVTLTIPAAGDSQTPNFARSLMDELHDSDLNDQDLTRVVFEIVIDGVTITVPMIVASATHAINEKQEQLITLSLEGNAPTSGDFPTAPTGTTTLLEKAFNSYNTPLAVVLTTGAAGSGEAYTGNVLFSGFSFGFNDAEINVIQYEFVSHGAFAAANA